MGLSHVLAKYAVDQAHVLVVEVPGHWLTRVAAELHIRERGWLPVSTPANADVLAVCGTSGSEMAAVVARLWDEMPGPRARVEIDAPHLAAAAFDRAKAELLDVGRQQDDSRSRSAIPDDEPHRDEHREVRHGGHHHGDHAGDGEGGDTDQVGHAQHAGMDHHEHGGHGAHDDHGGMEHHEHGGQGGMGHGGMEHGGHGGMDHGAMDMTPAGIPLAQGGDDRDGLEMDVLHLRMGSVLPHWPAGLVLRCSLQGDLIVDAEVTVVDARVPSDQGDVSYPDVRHHAARRCDNAAGLLALAGWDDAASHARRLRDLLLTDRGAGKAAEDLDRLRHRIKRAWLLRWSLRGVGLLTEADLARLGLPGHLRGDTYDRLLSMIERVADDIAGSDGGSSGASEPVLIVKVCDVVRGLDVATARLVVASLDLDPLPAASEVAHA
ncbi:MULTISPECIES: hypothetical protein [Micromonospora]|uniref:Uncharacterized protein n=1 Tax=Micromonospora sicca TaxID=2202420 RepID=A0A317DIK8_9ACTN|nr:MULTISPECIES: hypothetical protein [unclassified Micromonospora]MBM0224486.1 hypothetical protein [Micromonospora sp. ATA51]PWR13566.1 hypothetical protein DKT69_20340 [Micromonospora sp. 4G51]